MNINKIVMSVENSYLKHSTNSLKDFYKEGIKNPSVAMVFERHIIKSKQDKMVKQGYRGYTEFNQLECKYRNLKENKVVKLEQEAFWNKFRKLYPKTGVLRSILCKNDRIEPNKINPKAEGFQKKFFLYMLETHERNGCFADNYLIIKK